MNKAKVSASALSEIEPALKSYAADVERSDLSFSSQSTYIDMADNFVRWLRGEFEPGSRKQPYRVRDRIAAVKVSGDNSGASRK